MKKFLYLRDRSSKGAALIIVLALVALATMYNAEHLMAVSPNPACVSIGTATIVNAGNFYKVDDMLDPITGNANLCAPADNYGFRLRVRQVAGPGQQGCVNGGCVTAVDVVTGIGYSNPPSKPISFAGSATGSGFTANCTFN
jgi:hypothetical protein